MQRRPDSSIASSPKGSPPPPAKADSVGRHRFREDVVVIFALLLRLMLVFYGLWHDYVFPALKYTDVDYRVITTAAAGIINNESPFSTTTYRYTPLLALLMTPNIFIHEAFGKLLFVSADIGVALYIKQICKYRGDSPSATTMAMSAWLFNPLTATISTRGNAESVLAVLVLSTLASIQARHVVAAGISYGLAVHMKIYPIIYALPTCLLLYAWESEEWRKAMGCFRDLIKFGIKSKLFQFGISAALTFTAVTAVCYVWCGMEFIDQAYLYHLTRRDHRHNFSAFFYLLYLTFESSMSHMLGLVAFLPQLGLVSLCGIHYYQDLPFAWLLQTMVFVVYNKVCTAQYFVWFWCLLPLAIPRLSLSKSKVILLAASWLGAQGIWLTFAYGVEFEGSAQFRELWVAGLALLVISVVCICQIVNGYVPTYRAEIRSCNTRLST